MYKQNTQSMAKSKTITSQLKEIPEGKSLKISVGSRSEALSIRTLCGIVNKNRINSRLTTVISGSIITVTNKQVESRTDKLRSIKPGDFMIFENDNYDAIHSTSSYLNKTEGTNLKVKKVIQVKNDKN